MQHATDRRPTFATVLFWLALGLAVVVSIALSPWAIVSMNQLAATAGLPAIFGLLTYAVLVAILGSLLDGPRFQRAAYALLIPAISFLLFETWGAATILSTMVLHLASAPLSTVLLEIVAQAAIQGVVIAVAFCVPMALIFRRRAVTATCIALMPLFAMVLQNLPNASVEKLLVVRFLVVLVPYVAIVVAMIAALAIVKTVLSSLRPALEKPSAG